jgi:hypothetical protein
MQGINTGTTHNNVRKMPEIDACSTMACILLALLHSLATSKQKLRHYLYRLTTEVALRFDKQVVVMQSLTQMYAIEPSQASMYA